MSEAKSSAISKILRSEFSQIDDSIYQYIEGVLDVGDDFQNSNEVYEAIGEVLHEVAANKGEDEIRKLCQQLLTVLKPDLVDGQQNGVHSSYNGGERKLLNNPVMMSDAASFMKENDGEAPAASIWNKPKGEDMKVDTRKLEKAEAKLQQKQQIKKEKNSNAPSNATASQVLTKKETRMEAKGTNNCKDIRIENFDIAYGDKLLLQGSDLSLAHGRRYGFVGRNGLGKTTLLRMISSGQLRIPSHISILHVEQEVVGDETPAIQSVLECDFKREALLKEEKELGEKMNGPSADPEMSARLSQIYIELQAIDADKAPARAAQILAGLGFSPEGQLKATKTFSGGWRMRLALARALFSKPDLLLLDEPTNMLDMKAIIWLEDYLQNWPSTLLVVSHDRNFLDSVPTDIIFLHAQCLESYRGNYENFVRSRTEKFKNQQREYEAQQQLREHVQEFIDKFRYNAKRASLVQSKIKMLEKLPELKPVEKEVEVILRFPEVEPIAPPAIQLDEMSFGYTEGKTILTRVNLSAGSDSRICIVGENGAGKTTLLKILTGEYNPTSGMRHNSRHLRIGYFSQHHVDQLDLSLCPVELLQTKFPGKPIEEYRRLLGSFGVSGDLALQNIASLSGGQKSRVAFAVLGTARPNFLILDEPTNHLDIETIEALGKALGKYQGGVVLVSHDERLIRMVCKELWVCAGGSVRSIEGGFDEYRKMVQRELQEVNK
ncbi:ATP-binding cassette sub-family F member 3-like [Daphnia pulex]|uniref:ATP-binding cassette sub-family F member 3-like n=1 Tax=Daphnia pulex TaxID=6669 RepID=UPI001EDCA539|nr:ATP-binding cassette sub-family F member 3-like [Daphnia pulex]XP_046650565.1 ATP-binding cassette sub-family F member 3-like [Daphnia pulicaria]